MRRYFRAYPAISSRQQGADRLVYTEDDLRKVLWQAVDPKFEGERPSTIRLAADIYLTKPIELGAYQYNVTIDGGRRFLIGEGDAFSGSYLFGLPDGTIEDISFIGCTFKSITAPNIFKGTALTVFNDLQMLECHIEVTGGGLIFTGAITFNNAEIHFDNNPWSIGAGLTFVGVVRFGPYVYQIQNTRTVFSRTSIGVGCGTPTPSTSLDVDGGLRVRPDSITLSGTDPVIDTADRSFFDITMDATANGYIQMTTGYPGQIVVLKFETVSGTAHLHDVTGATSPLADIHVNKNHKNKVPSSHELVTFIYGGGEWSEMARSENT